MRDSLTRPQRRPWRDCAECRYAGVGVWVLCAKHGRDVRRVVKRRKKTTASTAKRGSDPAA